ncbi:hypothetical protein LTR86_002261 [Recurvomyces mirabilis]|nr:hypothetical protein LTR86_002261 [Recurvomyces mirabilis]
MVTNANKIGAVQYHDAHGHARSRSRRSSLHAQASVSGPDAARPSFSAIDIPEASTLDPAHPRQYKSPAFGLSRKAYRQLLGLNPFKTSYLSIYGSLDNLGDRCVAGAGVLFAIAAGIPLPLIGVIFGRLISTFPPTEDELKTMIGELLGVAAAFFVVTSIYSTAFGLTGEKIAIRARERLLKCLLHLDLSYLETHDIDISSLLSEQVDSIHAGSSEKVGIFIQSISYFVTAFTVGFILNAKLTGILLAAILPFLVLVSIGARHFESKCSSRVTELSTAANAIVESALRSIKMVQAFDMIADMCSDHSDCLSKKVRASVHKAIIAAVQMGSIYFLAYSVNGLAFYLGSRIAANEDRPGVAGTVFAVVFLILDSSLVVSQFAPFLHIFAQAASAQETINTLLEAEARSGRPEAARLAAPDLKDCAISIENVSFAYPARSAVKALNDLNLEMHPGAFTALVGASGGGKSTLVSLLTGVYPYSGSITIGGNQLRDIDPSHLRSQLAVVEQDHVIFSGSIFDNICHGVRNAGLSTEELERRCEQAMIDAKVDFVGELPDGLHTLLGHGMELSGGQMQRLCLARALIRRPAILICDEPTSALDARSEVAVMSAIKQAAVRGVTVLLVAHRLSTVLDADTVAVFSDGRVVESGKPQELVERNGVFQDLLRAQNTSLHAAEGAYPQKDLSDTDDEKSSSTSSLGPAYIPTTADSEGNIMDTPIGFGQLLGLMRQMLRPDCLLICLGVSASMINGALLVAEAIIFGNLIELINGGVSSPDFQRHANFYCLMFFVVGCVALVSWAVSGMAFGVASTRTVGRIQSRLIKTLLPLDLDWYTGPGRSVQQLMSAFTKDSGDLSCLSGPALGTILTTTISVLGGIILALYVAWKIAVVLLAVVPVMIAAGFIRLKVVARADSRRREVYRDATSLAAEACRHRQTVTIYALEDHILDEYRLALRKPFRDSQMFTTCSNIIMAVSLSITYFVYALAYWWGSKQVRNGLYTSKDFFIVLPAMLFSAQSAGQLFTLSPEIARARAAAVSVFNLLSTPGGMLGDGNKTKKAVITEKTVNVGGNALTAQVPKLAFRDVSFTYAGEGGREVLHTVSLNITDKHSVAFVGPSGAGKSSTISLMERFHDVSSGSILFDGVDVRDMDVQALRARIGLVAQESELLPGSIAHNIRLGCAAGQIVTDEEIRELCKRCGLHNFVQSLPDGYNTDCGGSTSSKLSVGQRQRVALARALIRNPEVLLLDEPTSALDAHSEAHIQQALAEAGKGRTTVTVAHRLASVRNADRIYVFDEGRIVESGTHHELVANGGLYASMAKAQAVA